MQNCFFYVIGTAQIGNTQTELKKLAEQNPELKDAYLAKQRRLKVSKLPLCDGGFLLDNSWNNFIRNWCM